jgi:hypothetical protein
MSVTVPDVDELRARVVGHDLPGGVVTTPPHVAWIGDSAMRAPHDPAALGIIWFLIAGLRGMGISIEDLVALAEGSLADGVLFGELELTEEIPLEVGAEYDVRGRIRDLTRKRSARAGLFDVLEFDLTIGRDGAVHGTVGCAFILRRGGIG